MKLVESFVSINGEGRRAGELAVFLRFAGCNLACSYCDTRWANEPDCEYEEKSPEQLAELVKQTGIHDVTLTGGEPMLQPGMCELVRRLLDIPQVRVEIETNGAVALDELAALRIEVLCGKDSLSGLPGRLSFTMDYKLPSSGFESEMLLSNFDLLGKADSVKFVSGSLEDLERAAEVIDRYGLTRRCSVFISPVFGRIDPQGIVSFMAERKMNDVRLQIQLHKVIWEPDKRGV